MQRRLDANDIKTAQMLKAVVHNGKFEIKGDAIKQVASLLIWMESLPDMIKETITEEKKKK